MSETLFEPESRLRKISSRAFASCSALKSIHLPRSVEKIGGACFEKCSSLSAVLFDSGSRLHIVGAALFDRCSSLKSVQVPSSMLRFPPDCLDGASVSVLEFESPSHLIELELDFPRFVGAEIQIPNSVCRVCLYIRPGFKQPVVANFDRESRLCQFEVRLRRHGQARLGIFVRFAERTLKNRRKWVDNQERSNSS
jgi:hypothetical protein